MKKGLLVFIPAALMCFHLTAQKVQVDWSDMDKKSVWAPYLSSVVNGRGDEFVTLHHKGGQGVDSKSTAIFTRYDRHFNPVLEKELFDGKQKVHVHSLKNINGNLLLFTQQFETHGLSLVSQTLQCIPVNPLTLEAGTTKDLSNFDYRGKRFAPRVSVETSANNSNVFVFATEAYNKDEDKRYYMGVWDDQLDKQWERIVSLPYSHQFIELCGHQLSNDGDVYLLCRQYEKEVKPLPFDGIVENTSPYAYKIFVYSKNDSLPREYTVDMKGKFVHQAILNIDKNGKVRVLGLYKNSYSGRISGSFIAVLDKGAAQAVVKRTDAFPTDQLLSRIAADGCGGADPVNPGLDPEFKLVGSDERADGSIDLLAEYTTQSHHSSVNLMASSMVDETTYKTYDVVVTSFKKDGRIVYTHLPKKQEESPFWSHISVRYLTHDNDLVVVYNDNKKNVSGEFPQQAIDSLGNSVFVMATINEAGSVQRQVVFSNDDPEMMADMWHCDPVGKDAMFLYVYKTRKLARSKYQYGLLTVK
ncbi:MAG TPA: hypothetical protein VL727_00885 [Puia sp.]|nr:hypothetical protein [Puia sp.]